MRRGGKNDSGLERIFPSKAAVGESVTKSCISWVSQSASSSSSNISMVAIFGLGGRKSGIDLTNKTDNLFVFGAVTERDVGMYSSSEVFGVSGGRLTASSPEDEEAALEMEEAGECARLRKRTGRILVAGLRVSETIGSPSRGGQGKSKDFPARHNLMSPDGQR